MSPNGPEHEGFYRTLVRQILRSRRKVTVMFTDVEGSTRYWDAHGDVQGRLMIDLHNRLLCPVIAAHRGRVVKHVGDAILAYFRSPKQALRAAIAIQQVLDRQRAGEGSGLPPVRIGLHTGPALIERNDIYGDAVNLAARLAKHPAGCDVSVSGATVSKVSRKAFNLVRRGEFVPKGKREPVVAYECRWHEHENLIGDGDGLPRLGLVRRQKLELAGCYLAAVGTAWFLSVRYLRWLAADHKWPALLGLVSRHLTSALPAVLAGAALAAAALLARRSSRAHLPFRLLKGGFGFALGFFLLYLPGLLCHAGPERDGGGGRPGTENPAQVVGFTERLGRAWNGELFGTGHQIAEVLESGVRVLARPGDDAREIRTVERGALLRVENVEERHGRTWVQVLAGRDRLGWVSWTDPPRMGVAERKLVELTWFRFRYRDLYALVAGLLGFAWGAISFRLRPA